MNNQNQCLYCNQNSDEAPLINIQFKGTTYWICPQHLPILIHKPATLADKLPGAEHLTASAGHDH